MRTTASLPLSMLSLMLLILDSRVSSSAHGVEHGGQHPNTTTGGDTTLSSISTTDATGHSDRPHIDADESRDIQNSSGTFIPGVTETHNLARTTQEGLAGMNDSRPATPSSSSSHPAPESSSYPAPESSPHPAPESNSTATPNPSLYSSPSSPNRSTPPPSTLQSSTTLSSKSKEDNRSPKIIILLVLIGIILLIVILGSLKVLRDRHSNQDSSAPRLLLGVRERVRGGIRTLEDRLGFRLWPGGKRGGEDEGEGEGEGEEGGRRRDVEAGVGRKRGRDDEEEEEEEGGDSSDDYSSLEGINLKERARNREEEERKEKQKKKEEVEERKTESVGGQGAVERGSDGEEEGGEERAPAVPVEESNERDLCDVTVL